MFWCLLFGLFGLGIATFSTMNDTANCIQSITCNGRGYCRFDDHCDCYSGYTTFPSNNNIECNYKEKSHLTAILLQTFFGLIGSGYFYIEQTRLGYGELALTLTQLTVSVGCYCFVKEENELLHIVIFLLCMGMISWWITAIIMISIGEQHDGNGVSLY